MDFYPRIRKGIEGYFITAVHGDSVEYRCTDFYDNEHDAWSDWEAKQDAHITIEYNSPYSGAVWH